MLITKSPNKQNSLKNQQKKDWAEFLGSRKRQGSGRSMVSGRNKNNVETTIIPEKIVSEDLQSQSISHWTESIVYARSRNVVFRAEGLKPLTKHYSFLDGISVDKYITSKFIEINMISGVFEVGELVESDPLFVSGRFSFRLCTPNHLNGPYNNPTKVFNENTVSFPLAQTYGLNSSSYSASSRSLNVDLNSLANPSEVSFSGYAHPTMKLIGTSSGAIAEIVGSVLVTDESGYLTASLFIPDPSVETNPKFINGSNTFTLINTPNLTDPDYLSYAESEYYSNGTSNITDINNITTRNYTITPAKTINTTTITQTIPGKVTTKYVYVTPAPKSEESKTVYITGDLIRSEFGGDAQAALDAAKKYGADDIQIGAGAITNYYEGEAPSGTTARSDIASNPQTHLAQNPF